MEEYGHQYGLQSESLRDARDFQGIKTNLRIAFKWLRQVPSAPSLKFNPCRRLSESPAHGFKSVHTGGRVLSKIWSPFTASKNSTSNPVKDADKTKASLLSDRSGRPSTRILWNYGHLSRTDQNTGRNMRYDVGGDTAYPKCCVTCTTDFRCPVYRLFCRGRPEIPIAGMNYLTRETPNRRRRRGASMIAQGQQQDYSRDCAPDNQIRRGLERYHGFLLRTSKVTLIHEVSCRGGIMRLGLDRMYWKGEQRCQPYRGGQQKNQRLKSKKWSVSHPVTGQAQFSGIIPAAGLHTRQLLLLT